MTQFSRNVLSNTLAITAVMISAAVTSIASAETRSESMAGAGIANGNYYQAGYLNPALMTGKTNRDRFGLVLPSLTFEINDESQLFDSIDLFQDRFDRLKRLIAQNADSNTIAAARTEAVAALTDIDGVTSLRGNVYATLAIPGKAFSTGLYIKSTPEIFTVADINSADIAILETASDATALDNFLSRGIIVGNLVTDFGVAMAREFVFGEQALSIGIAPKLQRIDNFAYVANIATFDDDDFDRADYQETVTVFNFDAGITLTGEHFSFALVGRNLIKQETSVTSNYQQGGELVSLTAHYEYAPHVIAGMGFNTKRLAISIDADLTKQNYLAMSSAGQRAVLGVTETAYTQFLRAGAEYSIGNTLQLRAGFRHDFESTYADAITAGVGLSPFGRVHIQLGAIYTAERNFGGSAQLAFTF